MPKRPCEFIFKELTHSATIKINGSEYNSKTSDDICGNKNSMVFYFDECAGVTCDICQKCDYETQTCITLPSNRERCKTDAGTGWCVNGACKIDPCNDCSDTQFCADKNDNKWSANPFECKELNFKNVILDFNGKKKTWLMSL